MVVLAAADWPEVALLALNIVQALVLAWVGQQQQRSSVERRRRRKIDDVDQADEPDSA
jgi:hypothetical protein